MSSLEIEAADFVLTQVGPGKFGNPFPLLRSQLFLYNGEYKIPPTCRVVIAIDIAERYGKPNLTYVSRYSPNTGRYAPRQAHFLGEWLAKFEIERRFRTQRDDIVPDGNQSLSCELRTKPKLIVRAGEQLTSSMQVREVFVCVILGPFSSAFDRQQPHGVCWVNPGRAATIAMPQPVDERRLDRKDSLLASWRVRSKAASLLDDRVVYRAEVNVEGWDCKSQVFY